VVIALSTMRILAILRFLSGIASRNRDSSFIAFATWGGFHGGQA